MKVFRDKEHTVVAVCDKDLLGETFRDGKLKLEVKHDFYRGVLSSVSGAVKVIEDADIANLVGTRIVEAAVQHGLVDSSAIIQVAGVPHVQIVRL